MSDFRIGDEDFLLDGRPHRILSGAIHYFRVHPDQWADRIAAARAMGLNTVETYVAWNAHAPRPDVWDTTGILDLGRFLDLVHEAGMHAIVRPGPYICAEWDGGGLPAWLMRTPGIGVRRSEPQYLKAVTTFLQRVYDLVVPRQVDRGGPVVLVQIENEYGAYGTDHEYLTTLVDITRAAGVTVPLTTVDQPQPAMLADGSLPGLHRTASFGSRAAERLVTLREFQPTGPLMCMEFWDGWFDSWGLHHHVTPAADAARELDAILAAGGSVNFYMFHGGTNFGLTNGANDKGQYQPIVTSYDYDAPLDEAGRPTAKFHAFREVLGRYVDLPPLDLPGGPTPPVVTGELTQAVTVADLLEACPDLAPTTTHHDVPTFDDLEHPGGLLLLGADLDVGDGPVRLEVGEVRDRVWFALDDVPAGTLGRDSHERDLVLPRGRGRLTALVEDQGRVNYAERIGEDKGLVGGVRAGGRPVTGWRARAVDVLGLPSTTARDLPVFDPRSEVRPGALLAWGQFELDEPTDLFLDTAGWGKGVAWVNGFALGRYWRRGPQRTLYVPGPVTRAGRNTVHVLELEVLGSTRLTTCAEPSLGAVDV